AREPGWTWENLRHLEELAALPEAAAHQAELRSLAAGCLGAVDLRLRRRLAEGFKAYHVAYSPDGKRLALVQGIGDTPAPMRVRLFDEESGRELPGLSFSSHPQWQKATRRAESATSAGFSPDGRWLVVGARSGHLHVWDLRQAKPVPTSWRAHPVEVRRV